MQTDFFVMLLKMSNGLCCCLALESGEGSVGGDSVRDLSRVKKALRQLLSDLKKVTQLSQMSS